MVTIARRTETPEEIIEIEIDHGSAPISVLDIIDNIDIIFMKE